MVDKVQSSKGKIGSNFKDHATIIKHREPSKDFLMEVMLTWRLDVAE